MSLGGKRYSKNGSQQPNQSQSNKSSIVSSLERRWSFMVTGGGNRESQKSENNTIKDAIVSTVEKHSNVTSKPWESQITKSEYEEIKHRVTAIETRISKEFIKLHSSLSTDSLDSVDTNDTRNGPERVLEKFEQTLEETETMNTSPMTEQLAKHLSRGLKIRSSAENRVFRSPSARKIGSIRRRSQENVRLTRNKSWHLGPNIASPLMPKSTRVARKLPMQPTVTLKSPSIEKQIQIPRVNLKRGRPNTFQNGLRGTQLSETNSKPIVESNSNSLTLTKNKVAESNDMELDSDLKNEQWMSADIFFDVCQTPKLNDDNASTSKNSAKSNAAKIKPERKKLNMNFDATPTNQQTSTNTPRSANNISMTDTKKTPMLPPRLPLVKKTPAKTPYSHLVNRNVFTPLWQQEQQEIAGRASIARLRSQNAGMVMAKAKLFDELVIDQPNLRKVNSNANQKPSAEHMEINGQSDQENKPKLTSCLKYRLNQTSRAGTNSPRRNKPSLSGVNRRQHLRAHRHTPMKKTPINMDKSLITVRGNGDRIGGRNTPSPAIQSPATRRMTSIDATPQSKATAFIAKPPRRIITPQNKRKLI